MFVVLCKIFFQQADQLLTQPGQELNAATKASKNVHQQIEESENPFQRMKITLEKKMRIVNS